MAGLTDPIKELRWFAAESRRYNIDIGALSETRLFDIVSLKEEGSVFTFLWKGYPQDGRHLHHIELARKKTLQNTLPKLSEAPQASVERLMTLLISEPKKHFPTVVCCPNLALRHRD